MKKNHSKPTSLRAARFCIWTVLHQDLIAHHLKIYTTFATILILFFDFAGVIQTNAALWGLFLGGTSLGMLTMGLLHARKKGLLAIEDPELREVAHQAMILYMVQRRISERQKKELKKRLDRRTCALKEC